MSRPVTVALLAERAELDLDDALVSLWNAGIDNVVDPGRPRAAKTAEERRISSWNRKPAKADPNRLLVETNWYDPG